jgi:hypothetical protein
MMMTVSVTWDVVCKQMAKLIDLLVCVQEPKKLGRSLQLFLSKIFCSYKRRCDDVGLGAYVHFVGMERPILSYYVYMVGMHKSSVRKSWLQGTGTYIR